KKAPLAKVIVQNAQGDPSRQQRLVEDAISQGAKVIVYTSADANLSAGSLAAAAAAKVPVVLYDHDAVGGKADAHVVFDSLSVGRAQGKRAAELIGKMSKSPVKVARVKGNQGEYGTGQYEAGQNEFLKPLIASGKVKVVCEQYTENWDPVKAQAFAEDCLTRNKGDVDVFLGMNDGTTGGSVAALIGQGFKPGQKLVTGGQDATVEALRYIAQGWQDNTVLKDLKVEANYAADVVASPRANRGTPLISMRNITKSFGSVQALLGASVEVHAGEVVALVGDNGAGKSTLVKVMAGVHGYDSGEYEFEGKPAKINSPSDATAYGIQTVYQ